MLDVQPVEGPTLRVGGRFLSLFVKFSLPQPKFSTPECRNPTYPTDLHV